MSTTATKNELRVMSPSHGDLKVTWDPDNEDETEAARAQFRDMKAKGFSAFRVDKEGKPTTRISVFDPEAQAIIMTPQLKGG